ncbi:hypothetical protein ACQEVF_25050 [Nonomuraea polychroma]|uniref:hypothetical protein n=1 Tax=Nonomuraea polychroma TaxID=46176 RepID=UPI003D9228AD
MTAPTMRHRQQICAAVLANLLTHDLPIAYWVIHRTSSGAAGLVDCADDVRAWAEVISGGATSVERYSDGSAALRATGTGPYTHIEVWFPLTAEQVAELDKAQAETAAAGAL